MSGSHSIPIYEHMAALAAAGTPFAVATLVRTQGSTPQVVGAKLVVTMDVEERPMGTLGGGCVEADAIITARDVLTRGGRELHEHQLTEELAWNTGLVCGGTMWILVERGSDALGVDGFDALPHAVEAARGGLPVAFVTRISRARDEAAHDADAAGTKRAHRFAARAVVLAGGRLIGEIGDVSVAERARDAALDQMKVGTPRLVALSDSEELLVEPVTSRPRLVVAGGGHVAKAIARQARLLDFDVTILEDRPEFADPARFDGASVLSGPVPDTLASLTYDGQSYIVIATRGHKLDADCVLAAARTAAPYIGLLGSRRKTVLIERMLREEGVPEDRIAVVHAPVGLDLGGRTPAEIALSILSEITHIRYGGTARPLRQG